MMTVADYKYTCVPRSTDPDKGDLFHVRYVLKPTNPAGTKPLFAIGLNPSAAYEKELDPSVENVEKFAGKYKGGCHFVMFNLCPHRTPNPKELQGLLDEPMLDIDALLRENIKKIKHELDAFAATEKPTVLACWGKYDKAAGCRQYFRKSLSLLFDAIPDVKWVRIKTNTEILYPLHPSNQTKHLWAGDFALVEWKPGDVKDYIAEVKRIYEKRREHGLITPILTRH